MKKNQEYSKYSKSIYIKTILLTILVTILATTTVFEIILTKNSNISQKVKFKLDGIQSKIDSDYLGNQDENTMIDYAAKGYVLGLGDEYSQYFTKEELEKYTTDNIKGEYVGIGIYISQDTEKNLIKIISPIEGSPAEQAGIQPGDYISKIDGQSYDASQMDEATNKIKGEEGTKVRLEIIRNNETKEFEIERKNVELNPVTARVLDLSNLKNNLTQELNQLQESSKTQALSADDENKKDEINLKLSNANNNNPKIGYIKITSFDEGVSDKFKSKIEELKKENIKSLIIDLRNNGGGIVDESLKIANMFTQNGETLLITKDKKENEKIDYASGDKEINMPVVILTNAYTASASEILTGALKDNNVAKVVGNKTFGKGVIQELLTLYDGSGLKLTTNEYYTPNRNKINKIGIEPDEKVDLPEEYQKSLKVPEDKDLQLLKAEEVLINS